MDVGRALGVLLGEVELVEVEHAHLQIPVLDLDIDDDLLILDGGEQVLVLLLGLELVSQQLVLDELGLRVLGLHVDVDLRGLPAVNPEEEDALLAGSLRQLGHLVRDLVLLVLGRLELLEAVLEVVTGLADGVSEVGEAAGPGQLDGELLGVVHLEERLLAGLGLMRVETIEHELLDESVVGGVLDAELAVEVGLR